MRDTAHPTLLNCERLEDRHAPATFTFIGAGGYGGSVSSTEGSNSGSVTAAALNGTGASVVASISPPDGPTKVTVSTANDTGGFDLFPTSVRSVRVLRGEFNFFITEGKSETTTFRSGTLSTVPGTDFGGALEVRIDPDAADPFGKLVRVYVAAGIETTQVGQNAIPGYSWNGSFETFIGGGTGVAAVGYNTSNLYGSGLNKAEFTSFLARVGSTFLVRTRAESTTSYTGADFPSGIALPFFQDVLGFGLVDVPPLPASPVTPLPAGFAPAFAVGAGAGGAPLVRVADGAGNLTAAAQLFPGDVTGGVRTATADFTGDGVLDLVIGSGPGTPSQVRVIDLANGVEVAGFAPFEAAFLGGIYAAAGDVTGDGVPDLVVTPDEGGGPRIQVFRGPDFRQVANFFGIDDPNFRGGARAALGDVNKDGKADLVVSAGFGGGPRIAVFDGTSLVSTPAKLVNDFFAFEPELRNGAFVAAGDVSGDGAADLIFGGGPGGGPRVTVLDGAARLGGTTTTLANFFAGNVANRGGVRVAARTLDGDALADLVTGDGTGAGSRVTTYLGKDFASGPTAATSFDAFAGFLGGVFVG